MSTPEASQKQRHILQSALESIARGLMPDAAATAQRALVDAGLWNADPKPIPNADPAVSVPVSGCVSGGAECC